MEASRRRRIAPDTSVALLTIAAVAVRLGCSDDHVYRLISAGELEPVDIAQPGAKRSKTRVRSDTLAAYIESRTRRTGRPASPQSAAPSRRAPARRRTQAAPGRDPLPAT